jgi:hypothetical protein
MISSFIDAHDASFTTQDRIPISEGPVFQSQVADFYGLLTSQGVMHTTLNQTNDAHIWSGGWLSGAIAGLYGLEQNLNAGASAAGPLRRASTAAGARRRSVGSAAAPCSDDGCSARSFTRPT